jgi:spiro-SPASM protein
MKNAAVINGIDLRPPALRQLIDDRTSFQRALDFTRSLPDIGEAVVLLTQPREMPEGFRAIVRQDWTVADLLGQMESAAGEHGDLFYFHADCPFMDAGLAGAMHANHRRYWADYTFADGYPAGLTPEILTRETVGRLRGMAGDGSGQPRRDSIFSLIKKDINSFDIETEISPIDMRLLRLSLTADTERNFLLLSRIVERGGRDARSICALLNEKPELHRTLPAFFPVQIVERCPQACAYCPYPAVAGNVMEKTGFMPVEDFSRLVKKIAGFCGDAVIDISLWGEPALHPRALEIISAALNEPGIELVIETSGVGWQPGMLSRVKAASARQPQWIVSLDASTEETYRGLRGQGFAEARRTADELLGLFPARTWVQAVRMKENEEDLEAFYKSWKARTENVIIQKYDTCAGTLPDRRVADLSPLKRFPCWHLKRDMAVLTDGTVPLCREDLRGAIRLGNALEEPLDLIWTRGEEAHRAHLSGAYPGMCAGCDEYYTYNF